MHIFTKLEINRSPLPCLLILAGTLLTSSLTSSATANELAKIGEALFFDTNLSAKRNQACASCHDPAAAFSDSRDNGVAGAVSLGDDDQSLGDRNTPTITYATLVPAFSRDSKDETSGGFFLDGRATTMLDQAGQPFTNPIEMALQDNAAVVERVRENPAHVNALRKHFGASIFDDTAEAFRAITSSIVAFENTSQFAPFDSKYDRYLRGEYQLSTEEVLGRTLFFSQLFNCHSCHLIDLREDTEREVFTNHRYHNIGLPVNADIRQANGLGPAHVDRGLFENPQIDNPLQAGKFRVPTLRNVAVTGPYGHNGIFRELRTVVLYYNKFTLSNTESQTNPETGQPWGEPEVPDTVDLDLLAQGQPISPLQIDALVAFLEALTDQQYEDRLHQITR